MLPNSIINLNPANPILGAFLNVHGSSFRPNVELVNGILLGFHRVFGRMPSACQVTFLVA
jgi:hypothetical protein